MKCCILYLGHYSLIVAPPHMPQAIDFNFNQSLSLFVSPYLQISKSNLGVSVGRHIYI